MKMRMAILLSLLVLLPVVLAGKAKAQFSSNVQGTVADSSGAVVPGAALTITNTSTGVTTSTKSGLTACTGL